MTKKQKQNHPIPDSIKIGYVDYQFDFWPDTFASTEEAQGEFFATHGKIGLKSSALESVHGTNTVLHEILHAIVYQYGLVETLGDKEEIVVNTMAKNAYYNKKINLHGGEQWRPNIHVEDVADGIIASIKSTYDSV